MDQFLVEELLISDKVNSSENAKEIFLAYCKRSSAMCLKVVFLRFNWFSGHKSTDHIRSNVNSLVQRDIASWSAMAVSKMLLFQKFEESELAFIVRDHFELKKSVKIVSLQSELSQKYYYKLEENQ